MYFAEYVFYLYVALAIGLVVLYISDYGVWSYYLFIIVFKVGLVLLGLFVFWGFFVFVFL